ncbi:MAG TPA: MotA/TolQ/ExbB proton channel family protein [Kofleriaceae bacterium]|nr:MotA/TolQ/ExbB proton channel family protein [Kofleriaceae bacterium]
MANDNKQKHGAPASGLTLGESSAGAGAIGLFGFLAITALALLLFIAESFFLSMLLMSFALLVYVAGTELHKLAVASLQVFFSSRHIIPNAGHVQQTVSALRRHLHLRKDDAGLVKAGPIEKGTKIKLPDNPLVRDLQAVLKREKGPEYSQFVAHEYYVDCREVYDHFHAHLEFVAGVMPLLGLIGTVVGLIGMFDKLGPNTSVETLAPELAISLQTTLYGAVLASAYTVIASRFDQRIKSLEYDYDILCYAIDLLIKNEAVIEVEA